MIGLPAGLIDDQICPDYWNPQSGRLVHFMRHACRKASRNDYNARHLEPRRHIFDRAREIQGDAVQCGNGCCLIKPHNA
jgi:hypothetical protein